MYGMRIKYDVGWTKLILLVLKEAFKFLDTFDYAKFLKS